MYHYFKDFIVRAMNWQSVLVVVISYLYIYLDFSYIYYLFLLLAWLWWVKIIKARSTVKIDLQRNSEQFIENIVALQLDWK